MKCKDYHLEELKPETDLGQMKSSAMLTLMLHRAYYFSQDKSIAALNREFASLHLLFAKKKQEPQFDHITGSENHDAIVPCRWQRYRHS